MKVIFALFFVLITAEQIATAAPINNSTVPVPETVQVQPEQVNETDRLIQAPVEEAPKPVEPERTPEVPKVPTVSHPQGCESYRDLISQYDWNVEVAMKVMKAESSCNSQVVNHNQSTRDYSVGLFQINLYGANARTRPSETQLKDPATNIAWAYRIYQGNGKSFIGQWGVCRSKVSCY